MILERSILAYRSVLLTRPQRSVLVALNQDRFNNLSRWRASFSSESSQLPPAAQLNDMYLKTAAICICFAAVMMVAASSSENLVAVGDYDAIIGEDVKRRVGKNVDSLIRFGKRRMYQKQLNDEYDDLLEEIMEKRGRNQADMMMRFGRARPNADALIRFG